MRIFKQAPILLTLLLFALPVRADSCQDDELFLRGDWGTARFTIEIADTAATRARGLMFRESLGASQGMLFMYPEAGAPSFWMKNTLIALDMLFITPQGVVQYVHANAIPGDLRPISGGPGVQYVLEIKGGMAALLGINPGTQLRYARFAQDIAAWPCAAKD